MFCFVNESTSSTGPTPTEAYPRVSPDEMDENARRLRDAILAGPRGNAPGQFSMEAADGTLEGPFGIFLFAPAVGGPLQQLGAALRTATSLTARERELAILAVAAELGSDFELRAHVPLAAAAGIEDADIEAALRGDELESAREDALVKFCRLNAAATEPHAAFGELTRHFERQAAFEIVALVAYYRGLASMLSLFAIRPPVGVPAAAIAPRSTAGGSLAREVAQLTEEREIGRLLTSLASCVDNFDFDGLAQLYAEDGELITPWGSNHGRAGLAAHAAADLSHYRALHHVSAGHQIHVTPGASRARARMTLLATHVSDDQGRSFGTAGGHYDIDLVREDGLWRLARVHIVPAWFFDSDQHIPGREDERD
jgi:4-carboxymuconolactone decarboxylase